MPNLDLDGPFPFTESEVKRLVTHAVPGNYALGHVMDKKFKTSYVGRSNNDLFGDLLEFIGRHERYQYFKYAYASSAEAAFRKQVRNFHDFGESESLQNTEPPTR